MLVKCPKCENKKEYEGNPYRPFCSERCKLIDLGAWASGTYAVPLEETVPDAENTSSEEDL